MIKEIEFGKVYLSQSGLRFKAIEAINYGLDCTEPYILYQNLDPTYDSPIGKKWFLEESIFLKTFTYSPEEDYTLC